MTTTDRKFFACLKTPLRTKEGEKLDRGQVLESAIEHCGPIDQPAKAWLLLQTPGGEDIECSMLTVDLPTAEQVPTYAFACLVDTVAQIRALEQPMDMQTRDRIGRAVLTALLDGAEAAGRRPGLVRTIRELSVGELCDLIRQAQAPCFIV